MTSGWSEHGIAKAIAHEVLKGRNLIMVPRTSWTGYECDLLVVDSKLRVIDVEIKISRGDLKADAKKDKWWYRKSWAEEREPRNWPPKVYKHYYVVPASVWDDKLYACIPPTSGVVTLKHHSYYPGHVVTTLRRQAKPNKDVQPISGADAIDLGRHASLRLWDLMLKEHRAAERIATRRKFNG